MKIETASVKKIRLSEIKNLDPITIILEDMEIGKGKIIIECYGQSWSAYWGGMGDRSLSEFFCSCDEYYLAKNLSTIKSDVDDIDGLIDVAKKKIIELRKDHDIDAEAARELFDEAGRVDNLISSDYQDLMYKIFGNEWWYAIPSKPNPEYEYLCRIIKAVKEALQ